MFDHLPVDAGLVRTERAGNAGLGVSGLDVTPQVAAKGGFKPTVFTQMSHSLVFHLSVKLQVLFGFGFVNTKIAMYLCITVNGDQVGFQQIYSLSRVITLITFVGLAFMNLFSMMLNQISSCRCVATILIVTTESNIDIFVNSSDVISQSSRTTKD